MDALPRGSQSDSLKQLEIGGTVRVAESDFVWTIVRWQVSLVKKGSDERRDSLAAQRLSQLSTAWSAVLLAHQSTEPQAIALRRELLSRYLPAAQRYLSSICRSADLAAELSQEFSLRFLSGKMHAAHPERGSFRRYVKTVLINLVREHARKQQRHTEPLLEEPAGEGEAGEQFDQSWTETMLEQAWGDLEAIERDTGKPLYSLLRFRVDHRRATSDQLADFLRQFPRTSDCSPAYARKWLQRSRQEFARRLTRRVRDTLDDPTPEQLGEELRVLGLQRYCA